METEDSLLCSQELTIRQCRVLHDLLQYFSTFFNVNFNNIFPLRLGLPSGFFVLG